MPSKIRPLPAEPFTVFPLKIRVYLIVWDETKLILFFFFEKLMKRLF
jgi:hypothetical protein